MRVLIASTEMAPFAKTGGLADVAAALPKALRRIGVEADCILPLYRGLDRQGFPLSQSGPAIRVPMGHREESGVVMETDADTGGRAFLARNDRELDRELFFCKSILEWIARSGRRDAIPLAKRGEYRPAYRELLRPRAIEPAFRSTRTV